MADANTILAGDPIQAPGNPNHVMWVRPFAKTVTINRKVEKLAETTKPLRVTELGRDIYNPVIYIPEADILANLQGNNERTFCPLKGHADYFDLIGPGGAPVAQDIAWRYADALKSAEVLRKYIAFDPSQVEIVEAPI